MCLILFSWKSHAQYPLVLAANRDEFYNRPTKPMQFWDDDERLLAGRDLTGGGTWLGIHKNGKFAALTNFREPHNIKADAPTRGRLISEFLQGKENPEEYLSKIKRTGEQYNGFNLLVSDLETLWYYSNRREEIKKLSSGIYGLSNHLLDTPWPKVEKGKKLLTSKLDSTNITSSELLDLLKNEQQPSDDELPSTGVSLEWERILSPLFIRSSTYGTCCSTALLINQKKEVEIAERLHYPELPPQDQKDRSYLLSLLPQNVL